MEHRYKLVTTEMFIQPEVESAVPHVIPGAFQGNSRGN